MNLKLTRRRMALLAVPAVLAAGAGTALAATSDSDVIRACAGPNGVLRLADNCNRAETPLVWNVQGAPGQPGPAGPQGGADPASVIGGKPLAGGDADMFARIDGIPGESTDLQHQGEIDVTAFGAGVKNAGGAAGGGGARARRSSPRSRSASSTTPPRRSCSSASRPASTSRR